MAGLVITVIVCHVGYEVVGMQDAWPRSGGVGHGNHRRIYTAG